jgi:hypothetical protein
MNGTVLISFSRKGFVNLKESGAMKTADLIYDEGGTKELLSIFR